MMTTQASALRWTAEQLWQLKDIKKHLRSTIQDERYHIWWQDIKMYADQASSSPIPVLSFQLFNEFQDRGSRIPYEQRYFDKRGRLAALVLMVMRQQSELESDQSVHRGTSHSVSTAEEHSAQQYHTALEDALWDLCNEYTWCLPAHLEESADLPVWQQIDLFAAETAGMLAELSVLLNGVIDQRILQRIHSEVDRRILTPLADPNQRFFWETADHNWSAVCASGCGIAALILEKDYRRQQYILDRVQQASVYFLAGYGDDGGCAEGLGYWVYGFGYYTYLTDMLKAADLAEIIPAANKYKLHAMARFPADLHLSDGTFVNFSDSEEKEILPPGLLTRLVQQTGEKISLPFVLPLLTADHCHRWAHVVRNLLWSDAAVFESAEQIDKKDISSNHSVKAKSALPDNSRYWPDLKWLVDKGNVSFAAKGGHNDEPHNHNDLGSFILHAGGENLICDPGAGVYTQAYFAPGREQILNISSAGHSVPQVNGREQVSGRTAEAQILNIQQEWTETCLELELKQAYPAEAGLHGFKRSFRWQRFTEGEAALYMKDHFSFVFGDACTVTERFISHVKPAATEQGLIWQGQKGSVQLHTDWNQYHLHIEEIPHHDHQGQPITLYRTSLTIQLPAKRSAKQSHADLPDKAQLLQTHPTDSRPENEEIQHLDCWFEFTVSR